MEITDIETIEFTYESEKVRDEKGHSHPGEPHEATGTITRVVTDEDEDGYCVGGSREANDLLGEYLIGEDPMEREQLWQRLNRTQRIHRGTLSDGAMSRIDCALWDFAGRFLDQPVYRLLGGHREKVPAYASTMVGDDDSEGLGTPEAYADFAAELASQGYGAIKLHSWMPPYSEDPERDLEACRAVAERVDDDVELMLDAHHYYSRSEALELGRGLEEIGFRWIEEPMDEHSISSYQWLTRELDIAVVGPETAEGKMHTRAEWIKRDASDISRVGVHDVGGITPTLKTLHLCESFNVECEFHSANRPNLQVLAASAETGEYYERGLLHPEYDYEASTPWLNGVLDPVDDEGYVHLPDRPGLGYDFDWEFVEENRID